MIFFLLARIHTRDLDKGVYLTKDFLRIDTRGAHCFLQYQAHARGSETKSPAPGAVRVQLTWCSSLASPLLLLLLLLALLERVEGDLQDVTVRLHEFGVVLGRDHS